MKTEKATKAYQEDVVLSTSPYIQLLSTLKDRTKIGLNEDNKPVVFKDGSWRPANIRIVYRDKENTYPKKVLELAYKRFQKLKANAEYKADYVRYMAIWKAWSFTEDKAVSDKLCDEFKYWAITIPKKWGIASLINPNLKLKKADLFNLTIKHGSPLADFISSFIDAGINIWEYHCRKTKEGIRKRKTEMSIRDRKMLCFVLSQKKRKREVARILGISKDTVSNWNKKTEHLSKEEREALVAEFLTSKPILDTDILDLPDEKLVKLRKAKHFLTEEGPYQTGRKLTHKHYED